MNNNWSKPVENSIESEQQQPRCITSWKLPESDADHPWTTDSWVAHR